MEVKKESSRFVNYSRNIFFAILTQFITIVVNLVGRRLFVRLIASEYVGLSGLFASVLTLLSLAELGVGTAIVYSLYKPIKENDYEKIKSFMRLYKITYRFVGIFILAVGALIAPFIKFFIKDVPNIQGIYIIYLLFVIQTASSYFFSYKLNFLSATQNGYIVQLFRTAAVIIQVVLQSMGLIIFENYYVYLVIGIVIPTLVNLIACKYIDSKYPFLKEHAKKLSPEDTKPVKKNICAMFLYKVSSTLSSSIDTILVSGFMGIVEVAIYSNYHLLLTYSDKLFSGVLGTITPSLGNLLAEDDEENKVQVFKTMQFVYYWLATYFAVGAIVLFNPFISIWLGEEYLFHKSIVIALVISATLTNFQRPCALMRDAGGLFWHGKLRPLAMTIINIVSSIIFVKLFGTIGVVLGTICSKVLTYVWYDPIIVFKYAIKYKLSKYFSRYIFQWGLLIVLIFTCDMLYKLSNVSGILGLIFGVVEVTLVVNATFLIVFCKTKEFKYLKNKVVAMLKRKSRKVT